MKLVWENLVTGDACCSKGDGGRQWSLRRVSRPLVSIYVVELWEPYRGGVLAPRFTREFHKIENAEFAAQELEDALCQRLRK